MARVGIITSMLLLFINSTVYCQKYTLGIKAGTSITASVLGDKDDKRDFSSGSKIGYFGAALINFPMRKDYSFQTEIGFAQRGRNIKFNEDTWSNKAAYQFLDGAMVLRKSYPLNWATDIKGSWFLNIGPHVSYWLAGKGKVTNSGTFDYKVKFSEPINEPSEPDFNIMYLTNINRWLFGIDVGVGVDAPTRATQRFIFELRFNYGLTYFGNRNSAFNRTMEFKDNLRANEKTLSLSINYKLSKNSKVYNKGKSTQKDVKKSKPRKKFDSMLH